MILRFRQGVLEGVEADGSPQLQVVELERTFDTADEADAYALELATRWLDGQRA